MTERRGIDAGTRVKVYLKSEPGTFVRGRINHPYGGEGTVEVTPISRGDITIIPEENVAYVEAERDSRDY